MIKLAQLLALLDDDTEVHVHYKYVGKDGLIKIKVYHKHAKDRVHNIPDSIMGLNVRHYDGDDSIAWIVTETEDKK